MPQDSISRTPASESGPWRRLFQGRTGIYTLMLNLGVLLFAIDTFVVVTILPTVIGDIGGTQFYSWTIMLFMVGSIIGAAGAGPSRDMFGRRNAYAYAGLVFLLGNAGAALAPNIGALLIWRTVQGLGGGMIIAQSYGLIGDVFEPELRPRILGLVSSTWGIATVFGPGFGGVFAEFGWWQGAFWALVPLTLLFTVMAWKFVAASAGHGKAGHVPYYRLAAMAAGIMLAGLTSQVTGFWPRAALLAGAVACIAYAVVRDRRAEHRMFPSKTFVIGSVLGASQWTMLLMTMNFLVATLFVTLFLQLLHGQTPIVAGYISGLMSLAWTLTALGVAVLTGIRVWQSVLAGSVLSLAGVAGLLMFSVPGPVWLIALFSILVGIGVGAQNNLIIALGIEAAAPGEETLTASSVQTIRTLGIAFASAIAGMVANGAGLVDGAPRDVVAGAIEWVYRFNLGVAAMGVLVAVIFFYQGRRARRAAPDGG